MKRLLTLLFVFAAAFFTLASCEKEEPNFRVPAQAQIIFDDNIDKVTATYQQAGNVTLKISANNAASVRITSQYTNAGAPKTKDLGTLTANDGVATLQIPTTSLRNSGEGAVVGSHTLKVDAILADGSFETRYFTAVVAAP